MLRPYPSTRPSAYPSTLSRPPPPAAPRRPTRRTAARRCTAPAPAMIPSTPTPACSATTATTTASASTPPLPTAVTRAIPTATGIASLGAARFRSPTLGGLGPGARRRGGAVVPCPGIARARGALRWRRDRNHTRTTRPAEQRPLRHPEPGAAPHPRRGPRRPIFDHQASPAPPTPPRAVDEQATAIAATVVDDDPAGIDEWRATVPRVGERI